MPRQPYTNQYTLYGERSSKKEPVERRGSMNIQEKIIQLLHDEYYDIDGLDCKQQWLAPIADQILSLIRQEIESAIPQRKKDHTCSFRNIGNCTGCSYNNAIYDIRTALQRKGLI